MVNHTKTAFYSIVALFVLIFASPVGIAAAAETGADHDPSRSAETAPTAIRVGTFNIRMFPCNTHCACTKKHGYDDCRGQGNERTDLEALGELIRAVDAHVLAVQEILEPERFRRFVRKHLGPGWAYESAAQGGPLKIGFLFNTAVVELTHQRVIPAIYERLRRWNHSSRCYSQSRVLRPAFVGTFAIRGTDKNFTAIALHLKSGPCESIRTAQWKILETIVPDILKQDPDLIVLGDFNDYNRRRRQYEKFCRKLDFTCVTEQLPCTKLFRGRGSSLDHVIVSEAAMKAYMEGSAELHGPCRRFCTSAPRWRKYQEQVSDHCPVTAEFTITGFRN